MLVYDDLFEVASYSWCQHGLNTDLIKSVCAKSDIPQKRHPNEQLSSANRTRLPSNGGEPAYRVSNKPLGGLPTVRQFSDAGCLETRSQRICLWKNLADAKKIDGYECSIRCCSPAISDWRSVSLSAAGQA